MSNEFENVKKIFEILSLEDKQKVIIKCSEVPEKFGIDFFVSLLESETDPICQWYSIRAFSIFKTTKYLSLLINILQKPDVATGKSSLHRICASAIGSIGKEAIKHVIPLLSSDEKQTQIAAVDTLGEIGDAAAIPILYEMMKKNDRDLLLWAALSLSKIGEFSIEALENIVPHLEDFEIIVVIDALFKIGTRKTIKPIAKLIEMNPVAVTQYFNLHPEVKGKIISLVTNEIKSSKKLNTEAAKIISFVNTNNTVH